MSPPLKTSVQACPIDDKSMLVDGTTRAIPYPKDGYNCNPFMFIQLGDQISLGEEPKAKKDDKVEDTVLHIYNDGSSDTNAANIKVLKAGGDPVNLEHCPDF